MNVCYALRLIYSKIDCMHAKSLQLCPTVYNPMDTSLSGSSVHGILQAGDLPDPGIEPTSLVSCMGQWVLYH